MHRLLAQWLIQHPWQAALLAATLGTLSLLGVVMLVVLAGAIPALLWLERGANVGLRAAALSVVVQSAVLMLLGQEARFALLYAGVLLLTPLLMAALLHRFGSLDLLFQLSVLLTLLTLGVIHAFLPQPAAVWQRFLEQALATLASSGWQIDMALAERWLRTLWGAVLATLLLAALGAVFMARWWQSLLQAPGAFGAEFRELRTGVALGALLVTIVVAAWFVQLQWLDNMAWVAMFALALQGLAGAHRRKADGRWQRGRLVAIYLLLVVPLFSFLTVVLLAGMGCADFWRRMRLDAMRA